MDAVLPEQRKRLGGQRLGAAQVAAVHRGRHHQVVQGKPHSPVILQLPAQGQDAGASAILDAAEAALRKNRLYVFPGRGNTTRWRARRLALGPLNTLLDIIVKRQSPRTANEPAHSPITSA